MVSCLAVTLPCNFSEICSVHDPFLHLDFRFLSQFILFIGLAACIPYCLFNYLVIVHVYKTVYCSSVEEQSS